MDSDVILVDDSDREIGTAEKMSAHQHGGKLHRAFSIFVFNSKGETMLQRRAETKYHGAGLWTNTTCSHPMPGEDVMHAAHRRLKEEMGFDCSMKEVFSFTYEADMGNGLTEHEFDHVIFGDHNAAPRPNGEEVSNWKWITLAGLDEDIRKNPKVYSPWLRIVLGRVMKERAPKAAK